MKMKEQLVNDQGLVLFAQLSCVAPNMRERRLSVLLAEDHMQVSFWFKNKPFENTSLFTSFYMIAA